MAELIGVAASIIQIAGAGAKLSTTLYNFVGSATRADQEIADIAGDVELTANALDSVGKVFEDDDAKTVVSKKAVQDANNLIKRCEVVFDEIREVIEKRRKVCKDGKTKITALGKLSWPMKEQRVELLRRRLESLKNSLMLLLHVLHLANGQAKGKLEKSALELEREKIRQLHQAQQDSLQSLQALESKLSKVTLDDEETLKGSSAPSRVPTLDLAFMAHSSLPPKLNQIQDRDPHDKTQSQMSTFTDYSDVTDSDGTVTDGEGEHISIDELNQCAKHVQKLLKRITSLQETVKAAQKSRHHSKSRVHKLYRRFCHNFETEIKVIGKVQEQSFPLPQFEPPSKVQLATEPGSNINTSVKIASAAEDKDNHDSNSSSQGTVIGETQNETPPKHTVGTNDEPIKNPDLPGIEDIPFTAEDDEILTDLVEIKRLNWEQIADFFPGRTPAEMCRQYLEIQQAKERTYRAEHMEQFQQSQTEGFPARVLDRVASPTRLKSYQEELERVKEAERKVNDKKSARKKKQSAPEDSRTPSPTFPPPMIPMTPVHPRSFSGQPSNSFAYKDLGNDNFDLIGLDGFEVSLDNFDFDSFLRTPDGPGFADFYFGESDASSMPKSNRPQALDDVPSPGREHVPHTRAQQNQSYNALHEYESQLKLLEASRNQSNPAVSTMKRHQPGSIQPLVQTEADKQALADYQMGLMLLTCGNPDRPGRLKMFKTADFKAADDGAMIHPELGRLEPPHSFRVHSSDVEDLKRRIPNLVVTLDEKSSDPSKSSDSVTVSLIPYPLQHNESNVQTLPPPQPKLLPSTSKHSIFSPIGEGQSILAKHWGSSEPHSVALKPPFTPPLSLPKIHQSYMEEDKPLFINPKQFHRIIKRRLTRQKLDEELGDVAQRTLASSDDEASNYERSAYPEFVEFTLEDSRKTLIDVGPVGPGKIEARRVEEAIERSRRLQNAAADEFAEAGGDIEGIQSEIFAPAESSEHTSGNAMQHAAPGGRRKRSRTDDDLGTRKKPAQTMHDDVNKSDQMGSLQATSPRISQSTHENEALLNGEFPIPKPADPELRVLEYHKQLMLLEQQSEKRYLMALQQQRLPRDASGDQHMTDSPNVPSIESSRPSTTQMEFSKSGSESGPRESIDANASLPPRPSPSSPRRTGPMGVGERPKALARVPPGFYASQSDDEDFSPNVSPRLLPRSDTRQAMDFQLQTLPRGWNSTDLESDNRHQELYDSHRIQERGSNTGVSANIHIQTLSEQSEFGHEERKPSSFDTNSDESRNNPRCDKQTAGDDPDNRGDSVVGRNEALAQQLPEACKEAEIPVRRIDWIKTDVNPEINADGIAEIATAKRLVKNYQRRKRNASPTGPVSTTHNEFVTKSMKRKNVKGLSVDSETYYSAFKSVPEPDVPLKEIHVPVSGMKGFRQRIQWAKEAAGDSKSNPESDTISTATGSSASISRHPQTSDPIPLEQGVDQGGKPVAATWDDALPNRFTPSIAFDPSQMPPGMPPQFFSGSQTPSKSMSQSPVRRQRKFLRLESRREDDREPSHINEQTRSSRPADQDQDELSPFAAPALASRMADPEVTNVRPAPSLENSPPPYLEIRMEPSLYFGVFEDPPKPALSGSSPRGRPGMKQGSLSPYIHTLPLEFKSSLDGAESRGKLAVQTLEARQGAQHAHFSPSKEEHMQSNGPQSKVMWSGSKDAYATVDLEREQSNSSDRLAGLQPPTEEHYQTPPDTNVAEVPCAMEDHAPVRHKKARKRTRADCLTCRKRRIRCGEERPTCENCIKSKRQCEGYNQRVVYKQPIGDWPNHPGVVSSAQYYNSMTPGSDASLYALLAKAASAGPIDRGPSHDPGDTSLDSILPSATRERNLISESANYEETDLQLDIDNSIAPTNSCAAARKGGGILENEGNGDALNKVTCPHVDLIGDVEPSSRRRSWSSANLADNHIPIQLGHDVEMIDETDRTEQLIHLPPIAPLAGPSSPDDAAMNHRSSPSKPFVPMRRTVESPTKYTVNSIQSDNSQLLKLMSEMKTKAHPTQDVQPPFPSIRTWDGDSQEVEFGQADSMAPPEINIDFSVDTHTAETSSNQYDNLIDHLDNVHRNMVRQVERDKRTTSPDSFLDFSQLPFSTSPSTPQSPLAAKSATNDSDNTALNDDDLHKPSHEYERFKQQTGLPSGLTSLTPFLGSPQPALQPPLPPFDPTSRRMHCFRESQHYDNEGDETRLSNPPMPVLTKNAYVPQPQSDIDDSAGKVPKPRSASATQAALPAPDIPRSNPKRQNGADSAYSAPSPKRVKRNDEEDRDGERDGDDEEDSQYKEFETSLSESGAPSLKFKRLKARMGATYQKMPFVPGYLPLRPTLKERIALLKEQQAQKKHGPNSTASSAPSLEKPKRHELVQDVDPAMPSPKEDTAILEKHSTEDVQQARYETGRYEHKSSASGTSSLISRLERTQKRAQLAYELQVGQGEEESVPKEKAKIPVVARDSGAGQELRHGGEERDIVDLLLEQWTVPVGAS